MATNCDLINSSNYNHLDTNNSNNILTTPEFEGVGYAPTFDRLLIYSQDKVKSKNMTALIAWCQDKVICCWCKLREYWTLGDYKTQLEEKEKQVEILEKKLREAEKKIEEASKSTESKLSLPVPKISPFHSTSVDPVTPGHPVAPNTSDSVTSNASTTTLTSPENLNGAPSPVVSIQVKQLGALLPPPPPVGALPPPPPPPPAIKTPTSTKLIITKKKNGNLKLNDQPGLFVTPEALKGIRLRKADNNKQNSKTKDSSISSGLVTLEQLKTVNLRRTQSAQSLDDVGKENIHQRLAHEMLNRRALKKTTIKRSPGGTPLGDNKQKRESGVGLTPVMTRALKRKFRLAKRESLSSDDGGGSNSSSPDISIYNQTINSSAGDLSWSSPTDSPTNFSFCRDVRSPLSDRLSISPNITTSSPNLS